MNPAMFSSPSVQRNLAQMTKDGWRVMTPDVGNMACGDVGPGRSSVRQSAGRRRPQRSCRPGFLDRLCRHEQRRFPEHGRRRKLVEHLRWGLRPPRRGSPLRAVCDQGPSRRPLPEHGRRGALVGAFGAGLLRIDRRGRRPGRSWDPLRRAQRGGGDGSALSRGRAGSALRAARWPGGLCVAVVHGVLGRPS